MKDNEFDVVIVGAGVIGLSLAFRLKRSNADLQIAVLGDPMNSIMASRAAAGMLAPFGECDRADRFFRFCRESLDMFPGFVEELESVSGSSIYFSMNGSIMPSGFFEGEWDGRKRFFREENVLFEVWDPETAQSRVPGLSEKCGEVIWVAEGQVNSRQMHDALMIAVRKLGVTIMERDVAGFLKGMSSVEAAVTGSGQVSGKKFVLAAGSWSTSLAESLNISLPLKPIKGQMCRVLVDDNRLEYTVHGQLTYIAPWRGGNGFVLGSTMEDRGFDPSVEKNVIQSLINRAADILPCLKDAPLIESWTGLRPAADDLMPVMGKSSRYDNLYYSTGHYRNGILQTPNQAGYLAEVILGTLKNEVQEFSPGRYEL